MATDEFDRREIEACHNIMAQVREKASGTLRRAELRTGSTIDAVRALCAEVERLRAERDALRAAGSWVIVPNPGHDECALHDCPPGLFLFGDAIGFKTEYGNDDAFVVESGEIFWGGTDNKAERGRLRVRPVLAAVPAPQADDRLAWAEAGAREMRQMAALRACADCFDTIRTLPVAAVARRAVDAEGGG